LIDEANGEGNCVGCEAGFVLNVMKEDCTGKCVPTGTANIN
jgi:hypothetical protein